jgi:hypothetical protein
MTADRRRQGVWPLSVPLPSGWYGDVLLDDGGIIPYMPPTSGLSFHRDVAERMFPLPVEPILVSCPDQLITRLAPLLTPITADGEALAEYRLHNSNNYGPDKVSAATFKKELDYSQALWDGQKRFISNKIDPGLANELKPISVNPYTSYASYIYARLSRDPEERRYYEDWKSRLDHPLARMIWFWKISIYLPVPVFAFAINLMVRQSWLKQMLARLRKML